MLYSEEVGNSESEEQVDKLPVPHDLGDEGDLYGEDVIKETRETRSLDDGTGVKRNSTTTEALNFSEALPITQEAPQYLGCTVFNSEEFEFLQQQFICASSY